jgi:LysM repeat protein
MEQSAHHKRRWRTGAALIVVGLAAGCTIYEPLDRGSRVPWAQAEPAGSGGTVVAAAVTRPAIGSASPERPVVTRAPSRSRSIVASEAAPPLPAQKVTLSSETIELTAVEVTVAPPAEDRPTPKAKPAAKVVPAAKVAPAQKPASVASGDRYTVGSGDTLSGIARQLGVGMVDLARANEIKQPYRVYAGQKLRVPGDPAPRNGHAAQTTTVRLGDDKGSVRLATGKPPPLRGDDFVWPVNGKVIGSFGPIDQYRRRDGIDSAARRGAPVLAAQNGIVAYAGDGIPGYGQMILLRHDQGYITTYAHNATLLVVVGEVVERGQVIARVGDSGDATQSMLHFELRKGRTPINPQTRLVSLDTDVASTTQ